MNDRGKTKEQLLNELSEMRRQVALLEKTRPVKDQTEDALRRTEETLKLILNLSTNFIILPSDEVDEGIDDVMKIVGEFAGVDRFYMFEFSDDRSMILNTHEWCAQGILPLIETRRVVPASKLPPFIKPIWDLGVVNIPDLPKATRKNGNGKGLDAQSIIIVPMVYAWMRNLSSLFPWSTISLSWDFWASKVYARKRHGRNLLSLFLK